MENKETKIEEKLDKKGLAKYKMSKKTLFSTLSLAVCVILIVVLSVTSAAFNPELLKDVVYWINVALSCSICIFGMITGQQMGDDMARNNPIGQFRKSLGNYATTFKRIDEGKKSSYFEDWLDLYRQKKIFRKMRRLLKDNGVHQMEVLDLDMQELDNLKYPWKKDWAESPYFNKYYDEKRDQAITYFLSYTPDQIEVIRYCLEGKVKVSILPKSFFMDALNQSERDIWESAANSSKKKNLFLGSNYAYRLIALVALSIVLGGLRPSSYEDYSISTAVINLVARIFTLTMAVVWGIYLGFELVKMDISFIDFKVEILNQYANEYDNGDYTPETIEERAKRIYEETEKNKPKVEIVELDQEIVNKNLSIMIENKGE